MTTQKDNYDYDIEQNTIDQYLYDANHVVLQ